MVIDLEQNSQIKSKSDNSELISENEITLNKNDTPIRTVETDCQSISESSEVEAVIMNATETMTIIFVPVILLILLVARWCKQNSLGFNFIAGLGILGITLVYSIILGQYDLSGYLSDYPYVFAVILFGASFGVNLISPYFTDKVADESKENFRYKELLSRYEATKKERDFYKNQISSIKSIVNDDLD
ncbi:hypothetical protein ACX03_20605 [Vibrio parahaemolyticus]|nr:hypothetical protein ACX03_20605 [Vibrio parahaemolyticus]